MPVNVYFMLTLVCFFQILKVSKRLPQMYLLGALYKKKYRSLEDLEFIGDLPNIATLHSQLLATLSTPAQTLSTNLSTHQVCISIALR